jgi:hypothetical protein
MSDEENTWVIFLTSGMALLVIALLLFDQSAWYVQYGLLAASMLLSVYAMVRADSESAAD